MNFSDLKSRFSEISFENPKEYLGFTIGTITSYDRNTNYYLTPIRESQHVKYSGAIVRNVETALEIASYLDGKVDYIFVDTEKKVSKENYGQNHIQTAGLLNRLGEVYFLKKDVETAENLTNQALDIFKRNKHPDSYISLEKLADIYLLKSIQEREKENIQQSQSLKQQSIDYLKTSLITAKTCFPEGSSHIFRIKLKLNDLEK